MIMLIELLNGSITQKDILDITILILAINHYQRKLMFL